MTLPPLHELTFDLQDEYNRKAVAEKVIKLLTSDIKVSPMVIDGGWGTGKTYFCHKLKNLLQATHLNYKTVYVDAFKADHADEPLMTLLAAITSLLPEPEKVTLRQKALPALRVTSKAIGKASISWLLKQDAVDLAEDIEEEIKKVGDDIIDHSIESLLKDHEKADQNIQALKQVLSALTAENPIVVFIDELDRCRPDFAVSMLENIKHIFDVEGVHFVLVTNLDQLKASINHQYGQSVNSQRYLDKFISFSYKLPNDMVLPYRKLTSINTQHFINLIKEHDILKNTVVNHEYINKFLNSLISNHSISLREFEKLIKYLYIYEKLSDINKSNLDPRLLSGYALLKVFGVYLFCFKQDVIANINKNNIDTEEICKTLGVSIKYIESITKNSNDSNIPNTIAALILIEKEYLSGNKNPRLNEEWYKYIERLFDYRPSPYLGERLEIIKEVYNTLSLYS
ncbi:MAG: P-loop NTPase fold protein [Thiofilum sp.]|uniref:KAP family P-loop NTPase fold protein n=1 Tax=Thiofilum sp. TaxID=2212733 RepID=UPI0025F9AB37|nr:P-loop NTPase fold protein [Thiofilum sp.]MBK8454875.1 AAA family ATPase [Thiofilum sp.]